MIPLILLLLIRVLLISSLSTAERHLSSNVSSVSQECETNKDCPERYKCYADTFLSGKSKHCKCRHALYYGPGCTKIVAMSVIFSTTTLFFSSLTFGSSIFMTGKKLAKTGFRLNAVIVTCILNCLSSMNFLLWNLLRFLRSFTHGNTLYMLERTYSPLFLNLLFIFLLLTCLHMAYTWNRLKENPGSDFIKGRVRKKLAFATTIYICLLFVLSILTGSLKYAQAVSFFYCFWLIYVFWDASEIFRLGEKELGNQILVQTRISDGNGAPERTTIPKPRQQSRAEARQTDVRHIGPELRQVYHNTIQTANKITAFMILLPINIVGQLVADSIPETGVVFANAIFFSAGLTIMFLIWTIQDYLVQGKFSKLLGKWVVPCCSAILFAALKPFMVSALCCARITSGRGKNMIHSTLEEKQEFEQ
mmetsp:Transcript_21743/g.28140  ORF Transcript_21743/g.28140 Transcript_21743/m.28140 type:complete len:420 (-) Transcript_21743:174-1433(-)